MRPTSSDPQSPGKVCVMLKLQQETAEALALPDGEPAENLHITLCCLEDADRCTEEDLREIAAVVGTVCGTHQPLRGVVGGSGRFYGTAEDGTEQDILYACPDVPGLTALREQIAAELEFRGWPPLADHGFTPHITLGYFPRGTTQAAPAPVTLAFDAVTLSCGYEGAQVVCPLGGAGDEEVAMGDGLVSDMGSKSWEDEEWESASVGAVVPMLMAPLKEAVFGEGVLYEGDGMPWSGDPWRQVDPWPRIVADARRQQERQDAAARLPLLRGLRVPAVEAPLKRVSLLGGAVKSLTPEGRIRAYAVLFATPEYHDCSSFKDWFTKHTDYWLDSWGTRPMVFDHGMDEGTGDDPRVGTWDRSGMDDEGVWLEGQLDLAHKYRRAIQELVNREELRVSSETLFHLMRRRPGPGGTNEVVRWPLCAASLTVRPADANQIARPVRWLG